MKEVFKAFTHEDALTFIARAERAEQAAVYHSSGERRRGSTPREFIIERDCGQFIVYDVT